eukprot:726730-Hanusia_phi.AAC.1
MQQTHNKRAGFFYGSSDGHPIVWNNDWNSLIHKEVAARDEFSRKYMTGKIRLQPPVYADISMDNANWNSLLRSTYSDLGRWGDEVRRRNRRREGGRGCRSKGRSRTLPVTGLQADIPGVGSPQSVEEGG